MAYLKLELLRKDFGPVTVVKDLDLTVERGEFVSILGPSGCGKTTTLRMIAGFIAPDGGLIEIDGQRVDNLPSHRRGIAMVFQNYALFPHMTVFDNVAFGLRMHKTPAAEIPERVQKVLELVKLPNVQRSYPKFLSGGQQQRVALARALVLNPKILLLDEPLSNLDANLRKQLRVELREIHRKAGITTVFVTHDLEEAFSLSDKVAVMHQGKLEQFGAPVDIFMRPASRFVANFVGHANLIEGAVKARDQNGAVLDVDGLTVKATIVGETNGSATLAVPPHLVQVSADPLPVDNCFQATVRHMSYLGSAVHLVIGVGNLTLVSQISVSPDKVLDLQSGAEVYVGWRGSDAIHIPH